MPRILPGQFMMPGDTRTTGADVRVARVVDQMPAVEGGLRPNDVLQSVAGVTVTTPAHATQLFAEHKGKQTEVMIRRGNEQLTKSIILRDNNNDRRGYLGASFTNEEKLYSTWSAPIVGIATTGQFIIATFQGFGDMIANAVSGLVMRLSPDSATQKQADAKLSTAGQGVTGPIGIFGVLFPNAVKVGVEAILMLGAIISIGLAVLNILPIPALDGGRWFVMALYRLRRKPLTAETEERIHGAGMMALLALTIIVTVGDVGKFFK